MDKFAGDIAIVTGGSSGIGQALIKRLLEKSDDLIVVGLARRSIDGFSSFSNFRGYKCDLTQAAEIESALSELKKEFPEKTIQILINNGGAAKPLPLIDHPVLNDFATIEVQSLEDVSKIYAMSINVNILGTSLMTRAVSLISKN
jgi:NAD(P)-dependent dehydrogenase (short-subunit alcohol dehydrogenase family)